MNDEALLSIRGLSKHYAGARALDGADLSLGRGEIRGLVGENGAGKSTLLKCLSGAVRPDAGSVVLGGKPYAPRHGRDALKAGLSFIHQELNLVPYLDARENIFLGRPYPRRLGLFVDWDALTRASARILSELGVDLPLDEPVSGLGYAQRAFTAIARAFTADADIYFLDEPGTALTDTEKKSLFDLLGRLRDRGKTVVLVSHDLDDVLALCSKVTVLRDGRSEGTWSCAGLDKGALVARMTGKAAAAVRPRAAAPAGTAVFSVRGLRAGRLEGLDLDLRRGEILGVGGLSGSGRESLLRAAFGLERVRGGSMELCGESWAPRDAVDAVRGGAALVPAERRSQGLVMAASAERNMSLSALGRWSRWGLVDARRLGADCAAARDELRLKAPDLDAAVGTLSGGNQQKVVFAKALLASPRLLLLEEPTQGVDLGAREELYALIRDAAARGAAILVAGSDTRELALLCDRVLFLKDGRSVALVDAAGLDEKKSLNYCYGRTSA